MGHPEVVWRAGARRGFTLVELLIVVVIIGILAAIVVPKYQGLATEANIAALADQLRQTRGVIELYKLQHDNVPPALNGSDWSDLTTVKPNARGTPCGPYITSVPTNMMNGFSDVLVVNVDQEAGDAVAGVNVGWVMNSNNGMIWATNRAGDMIYNEADPTDPNN